jgi:hypothetical protein
MIADGFTPGDLWTPSVNLSMHQFCPLPIPVIVMYLLHGKVFLNVEDKFQHNSIKHWGQNKVFWGAQSSNLKMTIDGLPAVLFSATHMNV